MGLFAWLRKRRAAKRHAQQQKQHAKRLVLWQREAETRREVSRATQDEAYLRERARDKEAVEAAARKEADDLIAVVEYFPKPKRVLTVREVLENPEKLDETPGVYGWYFDTVPPGVPERGLFRYKGHTLLYVGKASEQSVQQRIIKKHIEGEAHESTLKFSLGALLKEELGLQAFPYGRAQDRNVWFGEDGEKLLRDWMIKRARIAYKVHWHPEIPESKIINSYGSKLPLNLQKNQANAFRRTLKSLRKRCRDEAWGPSQRV